MEMNWVRACSKGDSLLYCSRGEGMVCILVFWGELKLKVKCVSVLVRNSKISTRYHIILLTVREPKNGR